MVFYPQRWAGGRTNAFLEPSPFSLTLIAWFLKYIPSQTISGTKLFVCTLGPTGGTKGYEAITGNPPDDMSVVWWINNHLLPEIYVERGQTYWFRVQVNE